MKKFIAILLVLVIGLFAFSACNKDDNDPSGNSEYKPVEKFDGEKLKDTWTEGEITFGNKNKLSLPCTVKEFMDISGLTIGNEEYYVSKQYKPNEVLHITMIGKDTQIKVDCKNFEKSDCGYLDMTVTGFNFFNSGAGNRAITVSAGLTVGVARADVEKALGIPEGKTSEDRLYTYKSELENGQKIKFSVSFNSSDIVNSISYDLV